MPSENNIPAVQLSTSSSPTSPTIPDNEVFVRIYRKDGVTKFQFQVPAKIVEIYGQQSQMVKESSNWPGLKFYYVPQVIENERYRQFLSQYNLFDNYGQVLFNGRQFNVAWMRTVEGKGEFTIQDNLSFAELCTHVKNALQFVKEYFEEYFRPFEIEGKVQVKF